LEGFTKEIEELSQNGNWRKKIEIKIFKNLYLRDFHSKI